MNCVVTVGALLTAVSMIARGAKTRLVVGTTKAETYDVVVERQIRSSEKHC